MRFNTPKMNFIFVSVFLFCNLKKHTGEIALALFLFTA